MFELRPYQEGSIEGLRDGFRQGHNRQVLAAATGLALARLPLLWAAIGLLVVVLVVATLIDPLVGLGVLLILGPTKPLTEYFVPQLPLDHPVGGCVRRGFQQFDVKTSGGRCPADGGDLSHGLHNCRGNLLSRHRCDKETETIAALFLKQLSAIGQNPWVREDLFIQVHDA